MRPPGPADRGDGGQFDVPLALTPANERQYWGTIFGRLKPGVTIAQAQAELSVIDNRLAATRVSGLPKNAWTVSVEPLKNDWLSKSLARNLWLLLAAVGFILLIACVNVANLLLAKGAARQKEIAVRASVGASRGQMFAQLIVESLTLAVLGGAVGIGLGWALMKFLLRLLPGTTLPAEAVVQLNLPVLLFTIAATLIAGVLFGCAPAWRAARLDLSQMLKQGSRSVLGGGRVRIQGMLVIAEFALALTLLAGAGLALHSFWKLTSIDIGVRTDHVLTAVLQAPKKKYSGPEAIDASARRLLQRLKATPGVLNAAITTNLPLEGYNVFPFQIAGRPVSKANQPTADFELVTPGYFGAFRARLVKGRFLNDGDRLGSPPVVMVSDSFVHRYLPNVDPLSQRLLLPQLVPYGKPGPPTEHQIVGVFHAIRNGENLTDKPQPAIFASFWQNPWPNTAFAVRTAIDPTLMIRTIGKLVASAVPGESLTHPETMERIVGDHLTVYRFGMVLFGAFAALALLLAALGIYGVMA
ncbi:MAG: FtsX-like permease family protein, partial [Bryobacteraceae bacterium]